MVKTLIKNWLKNKYISLKDKDTVNNWNTTQQKQYFSSLLQIKNGFRAPMELGTNAFNKYTIKIIIIAFWKKLNSPIGEKVVICHDQRKWSKTISQEIGQTLQNLGMQVSFFANNSPVPVPFLSYLLKNNDSYHHGIMITASHNQKNINGIKLMNKNGFQWTQKQWKELATLIEKHYWTFLSYEITAQKTNFSRINSLEKTKYLKKIKTNYPNNFLPKITVLFSSLHGTTYGWTNQLLQEAGYKVYSVAKQCQKNANFPTLDDPNPENDKTFNLALRNKNLQQTDLIILNDCDGDRIRVACRHQEKFHKLSGNQIAVILLFFLLKEKKQTGYIYRSFVSSPLTDVIAKDFNCTVIKTDAGFHNLAEAYKNKSEKKFILAFEESLGYLPSLQINNDKDGIQTALLITEIANFYQTKNKTLIDCLQDIYEKYGYFISKTTRYSLQKLNWKDCQEKFKQIKIINGEKVIENKKTESNKIYFLKLKNNSTIAMRCSQTEPIIKIYFNLFQEKNQNKTALIKMINEFNQQINIKSEKNC